MKRYLWGIIVALAIFIGITLPAIFILNPLAGILSFKTKDLLADHLYLVSFYVHVGLGGVALIIGWTGFSERIRKKYISLHRLFGKVYVVCFSITAFLSIIVSYYADGGIISQLGFTMVGCIALFTTIKAYLAIRNKQIQNHQEWMRYSYACCLASVTLRLWLGVFYVFLFPGSIVAYQITSWLAWIPNLVIAFYLNNLDQRKLSLLKDM
jgi:uncharacterized membrane protein